MSLPESFEWAKNKYTAHQLDQFGELMFRKAGIRPYVDWRSRLINGPKSQAVVEMLVSSLLHIRARKVESYGDRRYHGLRPRNLELAMWYCDMQRKMDRLEAMIFENDHSTNEDLIDAASDMAGYGLMGLELMFYLWAEDEQRAEDL